MNNWKSSRDANAGTDYTRLPVADGRGDLEEDGGMEGDWVSHQIRSHKDALATQDQHLDDIGHGVDRLGQMSLEIHRELEDQNRMLNDLGSDFESAIHGLDAVTRKTKELIKKSGGCRNFTIIAVLIAILVVLIFLVLYT